MRRTLAVLLLPLSAAAPQFVISAYAGGLPVGVRPVAALAAEIGVATVLVADSAGATFFTGPITGS